MCTHICVFRLHFFVYVCYNFGVCLLLELVLIIHYSCILSVYLSTCSRSRFCFHCFCFVVVGCFFRYLTFSLHVLCTLVWNSPCNNIHCVVFCMTLSVYMMWCDVSVCVCFISYASWVCFIFIMFARIVVHLPSIAYI